MYLCIDSVKFVWEARGTKTLTRALLLFCDHLQNFWEALLLGRALLIGAFRYLELCWWGKMNKTIQNYLTANMISDPVIVSMMAKASLVESKCSSQDVQATWCNLQSLLWEWIEWSRSSHIHFVECCLSGDKGHAGDKDLIYSIVCSQWVLT